MAEIRNPTQSDIYDAWHDFWQRFPEGWFLDGERDGVHYTPLTGAYAMLNWELSFHHGDDENTAAWELYIRDLAEGKVHLGPIYSGDTPHGLLPLPDDVEVNDDSHKQAEEDSGEEEEFEGFSDSPVQV